MSSNRREEANMNPMLIKVAIGVGVAVVSGIAAMFFYNRQQEREEPYRTDYTQDSRTCSICLDTLVNKQVRILNCGHIYHEHCISSWAHQKNFCPLCRRTL